MSITAKDILELLKAKYSEWVCVPECKNGSSWTNRQMRKMDFWAMKKSWSNSCIVAVEIKVSRSDFLRDDKWHEYLKYCNEFFFACSPGIIEPNELPPEVGLLVTSTNAKLLHTKKKATYRNIQIDNDVFKYILMCRAKITKEVIVSRDERAKDWREWLENNKSYREIGYRVSRRLRELVEKDIKEVKDKNYQLQRENGRLQRIEVVLSEIGLSIDELKNCGEGYIREKILKSVGINSMPKEDLRRIRTAIQSLQQIEGVN